MLFTHVLLFGFNLIMENKMKYPAMYETQDGDKLLYISPLKFYDMQSDAWHDGGVYDSVDHEDTDVNITREYLEGKCVKVISPEHAEQLIELCKNSGIGEDAHNSRLWAYIEDGELYFTDDIGEKEDGSNFEEITIPLPPKAEPESKEWPQVGDEVLLMSGKCAVTSRADLHGNLSVMTDKGFNMIVHRSEIRKPKTEAEILRDEIETTIINALKAENFTGDLGLGDIASIIHSALDCNLSITKKPQ